jgi:hypothetical protein
MILVACRQFDVEHERAIPTRVEANREVWRRNKSSTQPKSTGKKRLVLSIWLSRTGTAKEYAGRKNHLHSIK